MCVVSHPQVGSREQYEMKVEELMTDIITDPGQALLNIRAGGYDVHYQDSGRRTALHHVAEKGDLDTVKVNHHLAH